MARHRCIHLFLRRTASTRRIHSRKQQVRQPVPPRTPPFHRHRSDETPTPLWLRRDEAEGVRRHKVEPDHSEYVWQSEQLKSVERRKLAKCTPTTETTASAILPTPPTKYEGMDSAGHLY